MNVKLFLCASLSLILWSGIVLAEEQKAAPQKQIEETPVTRLQSATDKMVAGLDENMLKQFAIIESSYRTIRAVEDVQISVGRAIASCSKANADSAKSYNDRYAVWKDAVRPVLSKGRDKLDKMVLLQGFTQPSQVRNYLKMFDAAVIYRNQGIKAVPVQDKGECDKLLENMDDTQENLIKLLSDTLALDQPLQTTKDE